MRGDEKEFGIFGKRVENGVFVRYATNRINQGYLSPELGIIKSMASNNSGYKELFSHPQMVRDLLTGFVNEDWLNLLNFSTLEKYNASFITANLRQRMDDIIWRVKWGKKWLYLYIIIEFQSSVDKFMAVRIMTYIGLLYQDLIKSEVITSKQKLPPVLPLVLYNGSKPWKAKLEISELVGKVPRGLEKYTPHLQYLIIDESSFSSSKLDKISNLSSALFQFERAKNRKDLRKVLTNLIECLKAPDQDSLRRAFTAWLGRILMPKNFKEQEVIEFKNLQEVNYMLSETVKTWTDGWIKEGRKEGREEGRKEVAIKMLKKNYDLADIIEFTDLDLETIEALKLQYLPDKIVQEKPPQYKSKPRKKQEEKIFNH